MSETNLSLVLFSIEKVSVPELEYLLEAIQQELNFRRYQNKKGQLECGVQTMKQVHQSERKTLKITENSTKNSRQKCSNAQTAEISRPINIIA